MKKNILTSILIIVISFTSILLSGCGGEKYLEGEWYVASEEDVSLNFTRENPNEPTPATYVSRFYFRLDKNNVIRYTKPDTNDKYTSGVTDYYIVKKNLIQSLAFGGGDQIKVTIAENDSILYQCFEKADGTGEVRIQIKFTKRNET